MRDLAKLRSLSGSDWRVLTRAACVLPWMAAGIAWCGYRRTHALCLRWPGARRTRVARAGEAVGRARQVARLVGIVAGRGPVHATCLRRSLASWWILRRDGIEAVLRVGVEPGDEGLKAHAWIEVMGEPIGEPDGITSRYAAFDANLAAAEPLP